MNAPPLVRFAAPGEALALVAQVSHPRLTISEEGEADVVLVVGPKPRRVAAAWVAVVDNLSEGERANAAGAHGVLLRGHATTEALILTLLHAVRVRRDQTIAAAFQQAPLPAVGVADPDLRYLFMAGTELKSEGIDASDTPGAEVGDLSAPEVGRQIRQAHVDAQQHGQPIDVPFEHGGRPWQARIYPVTAADGTVVGTGVVIMSLAAQQQALRDKRVSEDRFTLLAQNTQDLVVVHDPDGTIQWASASARTHLGRDPEDLAGAHPLDFIDPLDQHIFEDVGDKLIEGEPPAKVSFRAVRPDGTIAWMESSIAIIRDELGHPIQLFTIGRSVDDRIRKEAQLEALAEDAHRAASARASFLAVMSHELRTPLHGILGMTQVLANGPLLDEQAHGLNLIATSGRALLELIDNVLDFSRIESGSLVCERRPTDVLDVLEDAIDISSGLLGNKPVELTWFTEGDFIPRLFTDASRLRQVLVNLISNAVRFTKEGAVWVAVRFTDGVLHFDVHDTGPGIPKDRLEAIFDPFTQVDASTVRRFGGSGLGLTIARGLIQALGGKLSASSEPGQGACFHIRIPLDVAGRQPSTPKLIGRRIAVVGSGLTAQRGVPRLLEQHGARPILLADPDDGPIPPYVDAVIWASHLDPAPWRATHRHAAWVVMRPLGETDAPPGVLRLPVRRSALLKALNAHETDEEAPLNTEEVAPGQIWPLKVLVVDDTPTNRLVAARMLQTLRYPHLQAPSGRKALEILASERVDVVLLDLHMPGMSGETVAAQVRAGAGLAHADAPPLLLALTADVEASAAGRLVDFDGYLSKPLALKTLANALRSAFEARRTGERPWITGEEAPAS